MEIEFIPLTEDALPEFQAFCRDHWPGEHPLVHNREMFDYYYREPDGDINFVLAREAGGGPIHSVCGFIKSNAGDTPDVWISYILTKKGSKLGLGFKLLETICNLTNCRSIACNNIRKKTRGLYEFLGYQVDDMAQYFRVNDTIENYTICKYSADNIPNVISSPFAFTRIETKAQLEELDFETFSENKPYKDRAYLKKRYFDNPWLTYECYAGTDPAGQTRVLLVLRAFQHEGAVALRVVDYLGDAADVGGCGAFLDRELRERGAEFCDWFAAGLNDRDMLNAGFLRRQEGDGNIIPFYLAPPAMENVTVTYFTSDARGYTMFRADGDQDRPNMG